MHDELRIKNLKHLLLNDTTPYSLLYQAYVINKILTLIVFYIFQSNILFLKGDEKVLNTFETLRKQQPQGPLVNSEYYVGWLSYWGQTFATVDIDPVINTMKDMLDSNVSFSMYMFHGGTNFGFSAGMFKKTNFCMIKF